MIIPPPSPVAIGLIIAGLLLTLGVLCFVDAVQKAGRDIDDDIRRNDL